MRSVRNLLYVAVALIAVIGLGALVRMQFRHIKISKTAHSALAAPWAGIRAAANKARKVYPFSVIPGGVYSSGELARSRRIDPVVARHYAGFGNSVRVQKTVQDTYMYMSYRKEDQVYWTKAKHRIPRGEYVVTDGKSFARARCGNRLSAVPQEPVMNAGEPGQDRLDKPEAPGDMYLASLEPSAADPLFSVPQSAFDEPVLDGITSAPKLMSSQASAFTNDSGPSPFPGGIFGGGAYPIQPNQTGNTSSPNTPSVPGTPLVPGGPDFPVTPLPTPEPSHAWLLGSGVLGAFLLIEALQRRRAV